MPELSFANQTCIEVHDACFDARGEMAGGLDFGFLARIMELMDIEPEEQLDIIYKIQKVERFLREEKKSGKRT